MSDTKFPNLNINQDVFQQLSLSKVERKRIEEDAKILANRIALLKYEDEKTLNKIQETRKKANQIYEMKLNHQKRQEEFRLKVIKQKNKSLAKKQKVKTHLQNMFNSNAQKIRLQSKLYEENKKEFLQITQQKTYMQTQLIRQQNEITKKKLEEHFKIKKLQNQCNLLQQANENEAYKLRKEQEINKMEQVEISLITKLQKSQAMQLLAYNELEQALSLSAQDFASKYKNKQKKNSHQKLEKPAEQQ